MDKLIIGIIIFLLLALIGACSDAIGLTGDCEWIAGPTWHERVKVCESDAPLN